MSAAADAGPVDMKTPPPTMVDAAVDSPAASSPRPDASATADMKLGTPDAAAVPPGTVMGSVRGLPAGTSATVILGNDARLASQVVRAGGNYRFDAVPPGVYFLKIQAAGLTTGPARTIRVGTAHAISMDGATLTNGLPIDFDLTPLPAGTFRYHWEQDPSPAGYEESANVVAPPKIEILDQPIALPDLAAAQILHAQFNAVLSDEGVAWNQEYAYRLLETMKAIPQPQRKDAGEATLMPSKWILTDKHLDGDITLVYAAGATTATVSIDAFVYATPRMALLDGERRRFFSNRLHHALVRYATRNGEDLAAVEKILNERFGCTTKVPDYAALTKPTTKEDAASFQAFHPAELVQIINTFEEMPDGYHKVEGLKYLVRRKDGQPNPLYPAAPAVAWAWPTSFPGGSYIEFMDSGFTADPDDTHRLILHEKSHFLWAYLFSQDLKNTWIQIGGWYPNANDPDGWSTTRTTEFVSAYAHKKNPDEDMAESLSYFVLNPAALESRAPAKFAFIRDRIMQGTRYIAQIQKDLTFEVLNLYPDYDYPGKIRRVDITAEGAPDADKTITVELELLTANRVFAGASRAYFRLYSSINTFVDMYVYPVDKSGAVLRGQITISKYAKAGLWRPDQIIVTDDVGNQRFQGVDDYGWKLMIDNPLEDLKVPSYVPGSMTVQRFDDTLTENGSTHPIQRIEVRWRYEEDRLMQKVYAKLSNPSAVNAYPLEAWGSFDAATSSALVTFYVTQYYASGDYGVPYVMMVDAANNVGSQDFSSSPKHQPLVSIPIVTSDPDGTAPSISLNEDPAQGLHRITIAAEPTNKDHPNGETLVKIAYQARDDKAGVGVVSYRLLDPQGISHFQYHYHPNFYTYFFAGDPAAWAPYEISVVLPVGSPPGTWGLQQMVIRDKAGNQRTYDFVEVVQFQVAK